MLELKKNRSNRAIAIRYKQVEKVFDRSFLFALSLALGAHFLGALLFHVSLFSLGNIETILPPTQALTSIIKTSTDEKDAIVTTETNFEGRLTPAQLVPPLSVPSFPEIVYLSNSLSEPRQLFKLDDSLHKNLDSVLNSKSSLNLSVKVPSVVVNVFGEIGASNYKFPSHLKKHFESKSISFKSLKQNHLIYKIHVDANTGEVFWFNLETPSAEKKQIALAESLLMQMRFQDQNLSPFSSGQIQFTFSKEDS